MTRYVFEKPDEMFHWIERTAEKLLTISREDFGRIQIDISFTDRMGNYHEVIDPVDKQAWKRRFDDEKRGTR